MSSAIPPTSLHLLGLGDLRKRWGWFFGLGVLLVLLGGVSLGSSVALTLVSMMFIGGLMIAGGILQALHAVACKGWGGFFVDLLTGILYVVAGVMMVGNPGASAIALTLMIALLLIFGGLFRIVVAFAVPFHNRMWLFLHGAINLLLGILIWQQWPVSGLWVIGLFVGIDMIFNGWALIMLGLAAKKLPSE